MKTASLPSVRVDPELRRAAEGTLLDGESISHFIETAVREEIARRHERGGVADGHVAATESGRLNALSPPSPVAAPAQANLRSLLSARRKRLCP